jgi:hypothetical protein
MPESLLCSYTQTLGRCTPAVPACGATAQRTIVGCVSARQTSFRCTVGAYCADLLTGAAVRCPCGCTSNQVGYQRCYRRVGPTGIDDGEASLHGVNLDRLQQAGMHSCRDAASLGTLGDQDANGACSQQAAPRAQVIALSTTFGQ